MNPPSFPLSSCLSHPYRPLFSSLPILLLISLACYFDADLLTSPKILSFPPFSSSFLLSSPLPSTPRRSPSPLSPSISHPHLSHLPFVSSICQGIFCRKASFWLSPPSGDRLRGKPPSPHPSQMPWKDPVHLLRALSLTLATVRVNPQLEYFGSQGVGYLLLWGF